MCKVEVKLIELWISENGYYSCAGTGEVLSMLLFVLTPFYGSLQVVFSWLIDVYFIHLLIQRILNKSSAADFSACPGHCQDMDFLCESSEAFCIFAFELK